MRSHSWSIRVEHLVQRVEHEAVAAERDQHLGFAGGGELEAAAKQRLGGLGDVGVRGEQADSPAGEVERRLLSLRCVGVQLVAPRYARAR
jgi:hypothetical protein